MSYKISAAVIEQRKAIQEAELIASKETLTKADEARINVLLAKAAAFRQNPEAASFTEVRRRFWRAIEANKQIVDQRGDLLAGTQTISYTQGAAGGFTVPSEFADEILLGAAQVDPLLDKNCVNLTKSKGYALRPYPVPAWDLSTYAAVRQGEASQHNTDTLPSASSRVLTGYTYAASLGASFELEDDEFEDTLDQIQTAFSIAFARGIGVDLVNGTGVGQPFGLLTGAKNSQVKTLSAGKIQYQDITAIYNSVNRVYRTSKKCAWVMSDATYQQIRNATDNSGRPLLDMRKDKEELLSKPVLISPSMPGFNSGAKAIVFGDLSYYRVRVSGMWIQRNVETPGFVENGKAEYVARMRADGAVIDPTTNQSSPLLATGSSPIVYATLA